MSSPSTLVANRNTQRFAGFLVAALCFSLFSPLNAQRLIPQPGIGGRPKASPYDAAVFRKWTSADGSLTTSARLIDFSLDGIAKLQRKDTGKIVTIASEKLSEEDQEYLGAFSQANLRTKEEIAAAKAKVEKLGDWGKWIDPEDECQYKLDKGKLQIFVPSGSYDLSAEQKRMSAPRILKSVADEQFVFEIKIDGEFKAKESVVQGRRGYHGAGILVMADGKNYIRLERASFGNNHYINFEIREKGRPRQFGTTGESKIDPTKPTWLRLAILDTEAVAGYRQAKDDDWKYLDRRIIWNPTVRFDGSVQSVGVAAVNSAASKNEPVFSERTMSTDKELLEKIDEDSF